MHAVQRAEGCLRTLLSCRASEAVCMTQLCAHGAVSQRSDKSTSVRRAAQNFVYCTVVCLWPLCMRQQMQYCGHRKLEYTNGSDAGICKAACLNEVQWQGSGADLLIKCGQVGRGSCGVRGTNVDPHDQVAVAEVGRLAGGDGLVWGGSEVKLSARLSRGWIYSTELLYLHSN